MGLGSAAVVAPPAASGAFSPLSLTPALWIDPSDATSVTISGSSGAYIGPNGLVLTTGAAGDYATFADNAAYTVTDEFELIVKVTPTTWAQTSTIVSSKGLSAGDAGFRLTLSSGVGIYFSHDNGVSNVDSLSSVNHSFTPGQTGWIKVTYKGSLGEVKFYTSTDGSSYSQLGTTQTTTITAGWNSANAMRIGQRLDAVLRYQGTVHRVSFGTTIGGDKVFDADFEAATDYVSVFTESALGAPVYVVSSTAASSTANYGYVGPEGSVQPGLTGNVATSPDSVALSPTTSLEVVVRARAVWSTGAMFYSKRAGGAETSAQGSQFYVNGTSIAFFSNSGASSVTHSLTDGTWYWLKVTADGTATKFYYAADQATEPVSWTQIGANQAARSFVDTGHLFSIGGDSQSGWRQQTIARLIVRKTIGGSIDFDANFTAAADYCTSFTESSSNAATVTITATNTPANAAGACVSQINDKSGNNRHLTQGTLANMPKYWNGIAGNNVLVFDGANDTLSVAGSIVSQPNTIAIAARSTSSNDHIFGGGSGAVQELYDVSGATIRASAGLEMFGPATTTTVRHVYVVTVNGASSKVRIDGGAGSSGNMSTGNLTNGFRVSGNSAGSFPMAGEVQDVVITSGAMGLTDLNNLGPYMATKAGTTWSTAS